MSAKDLIQKKLNNFEYCANRELQENVAKRKAELHEAESKFLLGYSLRDNDDGHNNLARLYVYHDAYHEAQLARIAAVKAGYAQLIKDLVDLFYISDKGEAIVQYIITTLALQEPTDEHMRMLFDAVTSYIDVVGDLREFVSDEDE